MGLLSSFFFCFWLQINYTLIMYHVTNKNSPEKTASFLCAPERYKSPPRILKVMASRGGEKDGSSPGLQST